MRDHLVVLALIVGMAGYFYHLQSTRRDSIEITESGENIEITNKNNKFLLSQSPEFSLDLRVFGYNENDASVDEGPFSVITHFFVATPLDVNEEVFDKYLCERKSLEKASLIQIIVDDSELRNKIKKLEKAANPRGCARITGRGLYLLEYTYKEEKRNPQGWQMMGQFATEPRKMILLTDIEDVPCG